MAVQDPESLPLYFHNATAFGVAGQIDRPLQQTIPTQASVALAPTGGHGTQRVEKYSASGILSFDAAYVEVGGSLDTVNNTYATYASSVVENLNIWDVIKADRLVSRFSVYYTSPSSVAPQNGNSKTNKEENDESKNGGSQKQSLNEPSFSISGSHFENLRIAGKLVNVQLALDSVSGADKYSGFEKIADDWLFGQNVPDGLDPEDHNYKVVNDIAKRLQKWKSIENANKHFWGSAVEHSALQKALNGSGLKNFGGMVCVPRFGVVYLAELRVHRSHRHFNMLRVHMCSPGSGSITGGGTGGGGGSMPPG
jgi:hypothetical protein